MKDIKDDDASELCEGFKWYEEHTERVQFELVGFQGLSAAGGTVSDRKGDLKARNRNWGVNSKKQWLETTD